MLLLVGCYVVLWLWTFCVCLLYNIALLDVCFACTWVVVIIVFFACLVVLVCCLYLVRCEWCCVIACCFLICSVVVVCFGCYFT